MNYKIPKGSLIEDFLPADHFDVHTYVVEAEKLSADDIQVAFWTNSPKWVENLMAVRNSVVKIVGLQGANNDTIAFENCIRTAGVHDKASIVAKSENETVLRLDDAHLSAHLSIHIEDLPNNKKIVSATTLVHYHNKLGKFYFYIIKPCHHLVVRGMLRNAVENSISKAQRIL